MRNKDEKLYTIDLVSETIFPGLCDFTYSVPNPVKPSAVDESFIRCHGWLGHLGNSERRTEADNRVHRERNHAVPIIGSITQYHYNGAV